MRRFLAALLALCLASAGLRAQAIETPEPFDSAGQVISITPSLAAALELRPPAWRIAGDYLEARLYRLSDESFVIVVFRRTGAVERYSITAADREYLRERTRVLPPPVVDQVRERVAETARETAQDVRTVFTERGVRNAFIRNQTILGLTVYAPSFAAAVTDDDAGRVASWLLVSGATYFGSAILTKKVTITESQNRMATDLALRTAAGGLGLTYAFGASGEGRAAAIFFGGLAGTGTGLALGRNVTPAEIEAGSFASTASAFVAGSMALVAQNPDNDEDEATREVIGTAVAAAAIGYPLGVRYPRMVRYNVTAGDINTLYAAGALGMGLTGVLVANGDHSGRTVISTLTGGFLAGLVGGDRLLVRRFDHTRGEATLVNLGGAAGALMGLGTFVLVDRDRENGALALGLGTLGGAAGIAATEYYLGTKPDAGRVSERLRFTPTGLAMAAGRVPGRHPVLTFEF